MVTLVVVRKFETDESRNAAKVLRNSSKNSRMRP